MEAGSDGGRLGLRQAGMEAGWDGGRQGWGVGSGVGR